MPGSSHPPPAPRPLTSSRSSSAASPSAGSATFAHSLRAFVHHVSCFPNRPSLLATSGQILVATDRPAANSETRAIPRGSRSKHGAPPLVEALPAFQIPPSKSWQQMVPQLPVVEFTSPRPKVRPMLQPERQPNFVLRLVYLCGMYVPPPRDTLTPSRDT